METYKFCLLSKENLNDLDVLFENSFGVKPKDNKHAWKYFENPNGSAILVGAFFNDKLVASGAMIPEKLTFKGETCTVYSHTELMTEPSHQKKGLAKKIQKKLEEEVKKTNAQFIYAFPGAASRSVFQKNGWVFVERMCLLFKPSLLLKLGRFFKPKKDKNLRVHDEVSSHLDGYGVHLNSSINQIHKSVEYLKWRTSNPDFHYRLICSYDDQSQVNGYLILSKTENNLMHIIDLESKNDERAIKSRLIKFAEEIAVQSKSRGLLALAAKGTSYHHLFKRKRYIRNPFKFGPLQTLLDFSIKQVGDCPPELSSTSSWDLKGINYDDV